MSPAILKYQPWPRPALRNFVSEAATSARWWSMGTPECPGRVEATGALLDPVR